MGSSRSKPGQEAPASGAARRAEPPPEKLGAGLLFICEGEVLLLKRNSRHNFGTWGLPGGNADSTDGGLLQTARREAVEEMGPGLPRFEVAAELPTRRGKRGQKHYTVFVARLSPEDRAAWQPRLNEEHSEWRWFKLSELAGVAAPNNAASTTAPGAVQLHPVVQLALHTEPHRQTVLAAAGKP